MRTIGRPIIYACARATATAIPGRPWPRPTGPAYTYRGYPLPQRRRSWRLAAAAIAGTVAAGVAVWATPATGRDTGETATLTSPPRSVAYSASAPSSAPAKRRPGDSGNSSSPNSGSSRSDSNSCRSAASATPSSGGVMTLLPAPRGGIPGSPPNSQADGTASGQQGGLPPPPVANASSGAQPCRQVTTDQVQAALASAQPGQLLCLATSSAARPSGSGLPSSVPPAEAAPQVPHVTPSTSGTVVSPAPNSPSGLSSLSTPGEGTVTVNIPFLTGCITVANTAAKSSNHAPAQIRLCGSHHSSQRP